MSALTRGPGQTPTRKNAYRDTIESALNLAGIVDAGVALYDAEGMLRLDYVERRDNQPSPFVQLSLDAGSITYQAVQSGQAVHVRDCAIEAPQSPATQVEGIAAVMAAPVFVDDRSIGAVVVTAFDREALTSTHRVAVDTLAEKLGLILSYQVFQSRHGHLQKLHEALGVSNRLLAGSVFSIEKLYAQACQICIQHPSFSLAWIAQPDKNGWFRTLAAAGPAQGLTVAVHVSIDIERPEGHGIMGRAWRTGRAAYLQGPREERQPGHAALEACGIHEFAAVPLKRNGQTDALLAVGASEPDYFGDQERVLFEQIGIDLSEVLNRFDERIRTQLAATAVQNVLTGVMIAEPDTQRILYSNMAMETLTGYTRRELQGRTGLFFMPGDPTGRSLPGFTACIRAGRTWQGLVWGWRAGHLWEASVEIRTITGPDRSPHLLALFGQRPEAPEVSPHDPLTGLPNAESLQKALASSIDETAEHGLVLIRIGVRDLTSIYSAYGHAGGNQILVNLAGRLRHSLPMSAFIARLEGDNFAVLTRAVRQDAVARVASRLLRRVEESVDQPFEIEGDIVPVMLATGVVFYPADARDAQGFLAQAETALGQTRVHYARSQLLPEDHPEAIRNRLATEAHLRHALHEGYGIQPWYQPKIDLNKGTLIGAEALVRWQDETRGLVSPGEFLPLVEAQGLTGHLDRTMRDAVLRDIAHWRMTVGDSVPIAINLSAKQFTDAELTQQFLGALEAYDLPASLLQVEITEHDVITDLAAAQTVLQQLEAAEIEVSLDDFGTGYSSLSMLRDLPLSKLKLDKSFVDRLADDERSLKVARTSIELAHGLGIRVVAEGIESQEQADILRDLGCDYAQGFFFAMPMPASEYEARWLHGG